MPSVLDGRRDAPMSDPAHPDARLVFTPTTGMDGVVGGAWWPRTRGLSDELPALLAAVASRLGEVVGRISLSATVWDSTPEQIGVGGRVVQVAWFRARDGHTVRLLAGERWHVDLLVIPPDTAEGAAALALALVARGETSEALHAVAAGTATTSALPLP